MLNNKQTDLFSSGDHGLMGCWFSLSVLIICIKFDSDWLKDNGKFSAETFKKIFSLVRKKMGKDKIFWHFHQEKFSCLYNAFTRFFSFNMKLICTCEFFKKLKLTPN